MFQFEKLDVYKKSLDWIEQVDFLIERIKGEVSYSLLDQLTRAAISISLNIAEGHDRWHKGEKRQFFGSREVLFLNVFLLSKFY